jgi:hypothetical protein
MVFPGLKTINCITYADEMNSANIYFFECGNVPDNKNIAV